MRRSLHFPNKMPLPVKEINCTMASIKYIKHQNDVSDWMLGIVSGPIGTDLGQVNVCSSLDVSIDLHDGDELGKKHCLGRVSEAAENGEDEAKDHDLPFLLVEAG